MKHNEYEKILNDVLEQHEIVEVKEYDDIVKVIIIPKKQGWGRCVFLFCRNFITCFGDVETFSWCCTWDTVNAIKNGNTNAKNFGYLAGKLEHSHELKEFNFSDEKMEEIKEELTEDLDDDELKEFNEKWEENYYMLGDVDVHRLGGLDDFFSKLDVGDYWEYYSRFEELPAHYYYAVAMLRCIENYFRERKEN